MKNKEKQKKDAGITLVAVVVTIIILIILATISINAILRKGGLIHQADYAKLEHRASTVDEEVTSWKTKRKIAKYVKEMTTQTRKNFIADQLKRGLLTETEAQQATETGEVQIGSKLINYGSQTLVEMFHDGKLKIGDYVNYKNPVSGTYTAKAERTGMDDMYVTIKEQTFTISEEENQLNWRVLGIDKETGGLKLIAGSPMKRTKENPYFYMFGAKGYLYGVEELNQISALYKNDYATKARSITIDDVNELTGVTEDRIEELDVSERYGKPYYYENQYTPEGYIKKPQEKSTITGISNGYIYTVNYDKGPKPSAKIEDSDIFNILFENTEENEMIGKRYWLASNMSAKGLQGVIYSISYLHTLPGWLNEETNENMPDKPIISSFELFTSYNGFDERGNFSVRPVVILKKDITEEQIQKIENKIEERWNYPYEILDDIM